MIRPSRDLIDPALLRGATAVDTDELTVDTERMHEFESVVRRQLELLGEDPEREGLLKTPSRVAKALSWLTRGYELDPAEVIGDALFAEDHENMVMVRDIELYSMCEHHMLPFFGRAHVAYIPDGKIVGLSKIPRIVEVFARRLQVQERLTEQIAEALEDGAQAQGRGRGDRVRAPVHDDARRREAELAHHHVVAARRLPRRRAHAQRVPAPGASARCRILSVRDLAPAATPAAARGRSPAARRS